MEGDEIQWVELFSMLRSKEYGGHINFEPAGAFAEHEFVELTHADQTIPVESKYFAVQLPASQPVAAFPHAGHTPKHHLDKRRQIRQFNHRIMAYWESESAGICLLASL